MEKPAFSRRIAVKQSLRILQISLLLGLVFTLGQIWLDLNQERKHLNRDIKGIISLHHESSQRAIYNLNSKLADDIVSDLVSHPQIMHAVLVDDFGDILAEQFRNRPKNNLLISIGSWLFRMDGHIETPLNISESKQTDAKLIIDLNTDYISESLARRSLNNMLFGFLYSVSLVICFLLLFYRYLSMPILSIANWVNQLDSSKNTAELPPPYSERDELGDLVYSFARLWKKNRLTTAELNKTISELSKSEQFARSLMENAGDAMFLCQMDSTIFEVNNQACETLGTSRYDLVGHSLADFSTQLSSEDMQQTFANIDEHQAVTFEDIQKKREGESFPVEARAIRLQDNSKDYILILARDISVRKQAEQQIFELAFFDTLTGLANRRLFIDRLNSALKLHQSNKSYGAVLYLDLDRFKTINDSLGHSIGDKLLCEIAHRLTEILPEESTCARFGGDEFVVLLPEAGTSTELCAEQAANTAMKIKEALSLPVEIDSHQLYCTSSIGMAVFPNEKDSSLDILRYADTALYRVKAMGRNDFQFYDPEMQSSAQERLEIEKGLHQALENREFELWYQPQYNWNNELIGAEALLRWSHPEQGTILPGAFIQIAEDSGQIIEIGRWVLQQSLKQLSQWRAEELPETFGRLAINISPMQFMQVNFVEDLFQMLEDFEIPGNLIELEITENMLLDNFDVASSKMKLLKRLGISFAIDDFGTGYSSLTYLRNLPLDILKIDRSFVHGLNKDSEQAAIIEVIIAAANRLNLDVIAEGVETESERDVLYSLGCNTYQGYFYSRPIPAADFLSLLTTEPAEVETLP